MAGLSSWEWMTRGMHFFWKRKRDNVCNWVSYFSFIVATQVSPSRQPFDSVFCFLNRCCPVELFGTRGGEMQREGPGKMASSLMSESKLLFHGEFLWSFLCHGSRGSWCATAPESFTGPGVPGKAGDGVYLCFFHKTFLKLSWLCSRTSRTRESVHWVLDSEARMRQQVAEWQDTKGKYGTS